MITGYLDVYFLDWDLDYKGDWMILGSKSELEKNYHLKSIFSYIKATPFHPHGGTPSRTWSISLPGFGTKSLLIASPFA